MAFLNCRSLLYIDLSSVKRIGDYVFRNCSNLTVVRPPDKKELEFVGRHLFDDGCLNLLRKDI